MSFIFDNVFFLTFNYKSLSLTHNTKTMYGLDSFARKFREFNDKYILNCNIGYVAYIKKFESFLVYENNIIKYINEEM